MSEAEHFDVLIAGQGAAAYAAALYAARYRVKTLVAGERFGGETAIGGAIENYPGHPEIDGFDLMLQFQEQVTRYDVPIRNADVTALTAGGDHFRATLSDGAEVESSAVILAIGRERRMLGLPNEAEWTGRGVSYCSTCDAPLYRDKVAAVVGGGNAAVEGALLNARHAARTYLIYRGDRLWRPEPVLVELLGQAENVEVLMETEVAALLGDDEAGLTGVRLNRARDGSDTLDLDVLFIEAVRTTEEIDRVTREFDVPLLYNFVEKGKSPLIPAAELEKLGFKIVIYPGAAMFTVCKVIGDVMRHLKEHGTTEALLDDMVGPVEFFETVGLSEMLAFDAQFAKVPQLSS